MFFEDITTTTLHICLFVTLWMLSDCNEQYECVIQVETENIMCTADNMQTCKNEDKNEFIKSFSSIVNSCDTIFTFDDTVLLNREWFLIDINDSNNCTNITVPAYSSYVDKKINSLSLKSRRCETIGRNLTISSHSFMMIDSGQYAKLNLNATGSGTIRATLFTGNCSISCGDVESPCGVYEAARITKIKIEEKSLAPINFMNLTPDSYYCARVETDTGIFGTITKKLKYFDPLQVPPSDKSCLVYEGCFSLLFIIILVVSSVITPILVIMVLFKYRNKIMKHKYNIIDNETPINSRVLDENRQVVLLLYCRDIPHFHKLMTAFKMVLEKYGNMKVLDPLDDNLPEEYRGNLNEWLTSNLFTHTTKVIIIQTKMAVITQMALMNRKYIQYKEQHYNDFVFTKALSLLQHSTSLSDDYRRVFSARFGDFCDDKVRLGQITPHTCFIQPKYLGKLISEIHGMSDIDKECLEELMMSDEMEELRKAIETMKIYCEEYPNYIYELFHTTVLET